MSDQDRDLRKISLARAREMLQKQYNYTEEYLKGISRWEVISLVRCDNDGDSSLGRAFDDCMIAATPQRVKPAKRTRR